MQPLVPHWTAYVQALATPVVALIAAVIAGLIAYRQWQTANSKVVLDLLEKRLEVYNLVTDAVFELLQVGSHNIDHKITGKIAQGARKSKFLFGPEVVNYLDEIYWTIIKIERTYRKSERADGEKLKRLQADEDVLWEGISSFHDELDKMVYPYMRITTKLSSLVAPKRTARSAA